MTPAHIAEFLSLSDDKVLRLLKEGLIPCVDTRLPGGKNSQYRADPLDVAVYFLAGREGVTPAEFWEKHGPEGTPERCRRLLARIRRSQAAA